MTKSQSPQASSSFPSPFVSDGWAMNMDSDGAKREISAFQLAISDAGTTNRLGFSLWVESCFK